MNESYDSGAVGWTEIVNRRYGWSLALICLGVSLHALDTLVMATMMPAIVAEIGGGQLISWTLSLYELGSIIASAACGLITLRYGLRVPMCLTTLVFATGCVVSAVAPEMWIVLLGRLLQGLGGGGLLAFSFVASATLFPRRLLARTMGAISVFWGASAFAGPLLGGLFVEYATWRDGFTAFAMIAVFLSLWILARISDPAKLSSETKQGSFPVVRLVWLSAGVLAIGYAGVEISLALSPLFIATGILCIAMFLRLDAAKEESRMLPRNPVNLRHPIGAALVMIFCFSAASVALSIYGALIITSLHATPILTAGYVIATTAVGWSIASALVSGLPERLDARMIGAGMALASVGLVGFVYSVPYGPVWLIALFGLIEGTGFGLAWAFISRRMCGLVRPDQIERTTSAIPTAQAIGYAVGASTVGIVANGAGFAGQGGDRAMVFAATAIFLGGVPFVLVGLVATYRFVSAKARWRV